MLDMTPSPDAQGVVPRGTRVGPYRVVRRLAVGGLGELLLAKATGVKGFEKVVAVKRILPCYAGNGRLVRKFLEEARLAAALRHANIAQVYEVGKTGSTYFFVREYVEGTGAGSIWQAAKWSGRPVPIEHALAIGIGAAAGLSYAHERAGHDSGRPLGIVHGSLSPSSILVGYDGSVKLVDFGVAGAGETLHLADREALPGARPYLSPEQRRREQPDRRSDIYALGMILYELTTGTLLGREVGAGADPAAIRRPSRLSPGYPRALERVILKAMARRKWRRYRTARALEAALEKVARELRLPMSRASLSRYLQSLELPSAAIAESQRAASRGGALQAALFPWPRRALARVRRWWWGWQTRSRPFLALLRRWSRSAWWRR